MRFSDDLGPYVERMKAALHRSNSLPLAQFLVSLGGGDPEMDMILMEHIRGGHLEALYELLLYGFDPVAPLRILLSDDKAPMDARAEAAVGLYAYTHEIEEVRPYMNQHREIARAVLNVLDTDNETTLEVLRHFAVHGPTDVRNTALDLIHHRFPYPQNVRILEGLLDVPGVAPLAATHIAEILLGIESEEVQFDLYKLALSFTGAVARAFMYKTMDFENEQDFFIWIPPISQQIVAVMEAFVRRGGPPEEDCLVAAWILARVDNPTGLEVVLRHYEDLQWMLGDYDVARGLDPYQVQEKLRALLPQVLSSGGEREIINILRAAADFLSIKDIIPLMPNLILYLESGPAAIIEAVATTMYRIWRRSIQDVKGNYAQS